MFPYMSASTTEQSPFMLRVCAALGIMEMGMFFMLPHYVRCACAMRPEQRRSAGYIEYIQYMVSGAR